MVLRAHSIVPRVVCRQDTTHITHMECVLMTWNRVYLLYSCYAITHAVLIYVCTDSEAVVLKVKEVQFLRLLSESDTHCPHC